MAAYTLFDLTYRLARELGVAFEGTVTTGGTTTIIDNIYLLGRFEDSSFVAGTIWILYNANNVGIAPQGEMARISAFVKATGLVTFTPALTAIEASDRYAIADDMYTKDVLTQAINQVLAEILIPYIDDATVETDTSITEYTLPIGVLDRDIEVWINRNDTTDDNYWFPMHDWYIQESATGTAKELIFQNQPPEPYHIRIKYWLPHPPLNATSDKLRESIDINRVVLSAAYRLLVWKKAQKAVDDPVLDQRIAELYARSEAMKWRNPARKDSIKLATLGSTDNITIDY